MDRLGDELAVVDAAQHARGRGRARGRLGRRAVDDLAHRAGLGQALGGGLHGLEHAQTLEALLDLGGRELGAVRARRSQARTPPARPDAAPVAARLGRDLEQVGDDDVALADARW